LLQNANELGDFHVCGVLTDEAISAYKEPPVASLNERRAILSDLRCVDMVVVQDSLDPTENIKKLLNQFGNVKIILVFGSNWKKVPGKEFIKKINGTIVQPDFYEKLSSKNIIQKLVKNSGGHL
jgi:bifunctional ADP-heptose synthase (sugar kinase/adenylyltransferase)